MALESHVGSAWKTQRCRPGAAKHAGRSGDQKSAILEEIHDGVQVLLSALLPSHSFFPPFRRGSSLPVCEAKSSYERPLAEFLTHQCPLRGCLARFSGFGLTRWQLCDRAIPSVAASATDAKLTPSKFKTERRSFRCRENSQISGVFQCCFAVNAVSLFHHAHAQPVVQHFYHICPQLSGLFRRPAWTRPQHPHAMTMTGLGSLAAIIWVDPDLDPRRCSDRTSRPTVCGP
jgi:hypothetical protein